MLEPGKFLTPEEVKRLLQTAAERSKQASARRDKVSARDHFILDLALETGLRVMEIARLKCGDFFLTENEGSLIVRKGKGGKKRLVWFNGVFRQHFQEYLLWKQAAGESTGPQAPLLLSSNTGGHMTTRALQKAFKRCAARAGIPEHYSFHSLRHTFASELYRVSSHNLRLVQKQLGHSRITTTQVYADVMNPDLIRSLSKLYT